MDCLEKKVQYIGVLDNNRDNIPQITINKLNHLQFYLKSQEETGFRVRGITCYPNRLLNATIDEDEQLEPEMRIQKAAEYLKDKLFVFFSKSKDGERNSAWDVYVTKQPKYYEKETPFVMIPVFAEKDNAAEIAWNEARVKRGERKEEFDREYCSFSEWKERVNKREPLGRIFGRIAGSLNRSFVLWREGKKLYAVGPISNYTYRKGWVIEGNTNRVICLEDAFDYIVHDAEINPTMAFVPLSICQLLEEKLANTEDCEDILSLNITGDIKKLPVTDEVYTLEKGVPYIGALEYGSNWQPSVYVNTVNHIQFTIKALEENSFHIRGISVRPDAFQNAVLKEEAQLENEERIGNAVKELQNKLFVFYDSNRKGKRVIAKDVYVTGQPEFYSKSDPFAMIPVFAGKDDEEEKEWNEERVRKGLGAWELDREYIDLSEWRGCVNNKKSLGRLGGRFAGGLKYRFVLWREGKKLYAVGPIDSYTYRQGWILEGNTNRVICIENAFDKIVYDTKINPTIAYVPLSVCRFLEEMLEDAEDSEDVLTAYITETSVKTEQDLCINIPVFAGKNEQTEEEWNRKREEQGEKRWQFGRGYENFSKWKEFIREGKGIGISYGCNPKKYNFSFVLWREEGKLYAVGPVEHNVQTASWQLKGGYLHKVLLEELTDKAVYDTEENPSAARLPFLECKRIDEKFEEIRRDEETNPHVNIPVFAVKDDAMEEEWNKKKSERGEKTWLFGRNYESYTEWIARIKEGTGLGFIYCSNPKTYHQSFVLWREEGKLFAVGPVENKKEEGFTDWHLAGNDLRKISLEEIIKDFVYDAKENPSLVQLKLSECELIKEKLAEPEEEDYVTIPVFFGKNDPALIEWNNKREGTAGNKNHIYRRYETYAEWIEYIQKRKGLGEIYNYAPERHNYTFVLWKEEENLYAVGPVKNVGKSGTWVLAGHYIQCVLLSEITDKVIYQPEDDPMLAQLQPSECLYIENILEEMKTEEKGRVEAYEAEDELRTGVIYIGEVEYNWYNQPSVFVNRRNRLQFVIQSQEEHSFRANGVQAFSDSLKNMTIDENNVQRAAEILQEKLFVFEVDDYNKNFVRWVYAVKQPKYYDYEDLFAIIPVFAPRNAIDDLMWAKERVAKGIPEWDFRREYKNFGEWKECVNQGKPIGEIFGKIGIYLYHSFVLWREENRLFAVGPITKYSDSARGRMIEGNTNRVVCITDALDKIVYDTKINPTLAYVPLSVCDLLEETLENMEDSEEVLYINLEGRVVDKPEDEPEEESGCYVDVPVFTGAKDPVEKAWSERINKTGEKRVQLSRGAITFTQWKNQILKEKTVGQTYQVNAETYYLPFVLWRGGGELYAIGPVETIPVGGGWCFRGNPICKIRLRDLTDNIIYDMEENPTKASLPLSDCRYIAKKLEEKKKEEEKDPRIDIPVVEANYNSNTYYQPFILWKEAGELYAVGPLKRGKQGKNWALNENSVCRVLLRESTDYYDIEENETMAQLPQSECELIKERLNVRSQEVLQERRIAAAAIRRTSTSRAWKFIDRKWDNK